MSIETLGVLAVDVRLYQPMYKFLTDLEPLTALLSSEAKDFIAERHSMNLLDTVEKMRLACTSACACVQPFGEVYKAISLLMEDIDDIAEILTGDRTHFHVKMHSINT